MIAIMTLNAFHALYNGHGLFTAKNSGWIGLLTGFYIFMSCSLQKTVYIAYVDSNASQF